VRRLAIGLLTLAVAIGGCGGGKTKRAVPDVVGQRLDVAKSTVKDAGYEFEVIGGGTFGVVVEANWTVCQQTPSAGSTGADKVKLIVDRQCTGAAIESPSAGAGNFVMPDLVGLVLQDAQDQLQALGSHNLDQEDAAGLGRIQILDSNWMVCRQSPSPGTEVSLDGLVTLWSVKLDESCP
jgi:beta-lactam-binding protein with PASTA domain